MYYPSYSELKQLANDYPVVPVSKELFSDVTTPIKVLKILKNISQHVFLLESVEQMKYWGRYSFLGFEPSMEISCNNHILTVKQLKENTKIQQYVDNPNDFIRSILKKYQSPKLNKLPTFSGGLVGYFGYEYLQYVEKKLDCLQSEKLFNDVDLMLFDKVIAFDNYQKKIILIVNIKTDELAKNYQQAQQDLEYLADLIMHGQEAQITNGKVLSEIRRDFSEAEYCKVVDKVKNYIKAGDIFQAVISNELNVDFTGSLCNVYRMLCRTNPSPYMFYLTSKDFELVGASPETLVKLDGKTLKTFPIAGTLPRGKNAQEDELFSQRLLHDEKELAEHNMLVDLGRNDLGKISKFNSMLIENMHKIEYFSHVMHLTTTIKSEIDDKYDALDAVMATLPAGTLSGAPKLRAMEIIHELEKSPRGIYGGAIGYIDFSGNLDLCIGIRMAVAKNGKLFIRSGGGIVQDSEPQQEYLETINKAKAIMEAIYKAQEVNDYDFTNR